MSNETKVKHTPGPWVIRNDHWIRGGPHELPLAKVVTSASQEGDINHEESEANARILAAALDMFEALEDLVSYGTCVCECGHPACKLCKYTKAARAAITKATL